MINLFDAAAYLKNNQDVADAVALGYITAEQHFEMYGHAEGRDPGPYFNVDSYLDSNPDVAELAENNKSIAYTHFLKYGVSEGRSPTGFFNPGFYLDHNPDVAQAVEAGYINATEHFLLYGHNESRQISLSINLKSYLSANPDVSQAVSIGHVNALQHLLTYGLKEQRDLGNGLDLKEFANDPVFNEALTANDMDAILLRVDTIAPFMPNFSPPLGWSLPKNTALPTDFVPLAGNNLVIPTGFEIAATTPLPPAFGSSQANNPEDTIPSAPEPEAPVKPEMPGDPQAPENPTQPEPEEPNEEIPPTPFSDWTLVYPEYEKLILANQKNQKEWIFDRKMPHNLKAIGSNTGNNKILYQVEAGSSSSSGTASTESGIFYLFDAENGFKKLSSYNGTFSISSQGDLAYLGAESVVIDAELNQTILSTLHIPPVNSKVFWNDDNSGVWFSAYSEPYGTELFYYTINEDMSLKGGLVKDIEPGSDSGISSSYLDENLTILPNNNAIFYSKDSRVWISDGSTEGTQELLLPSGYTLSNLYNNPITLFQDKAVFSISDSYSHNLIMTQGSEESMVVIELDKSYSSPKVLWTTDEAMFFVTSSDATQLYKADIDGKHEQLMNVMSLDLLGYTNDKAFLAVHDDTHGKELWVLDTQTGEHHLVKDILSGSGSSIGQYPQAEMVGGKLLFNAYTSATQQQLFLSDGTEAGTTALSQNTAKVITTLGNHVFYQDGDSLYVVNTELDQPESVFIKDNISTYFTDLKHDEDQIFFRTSGDNAVYAYNWREKQLEKIFDSVEVFTVAAENVVSGLKLHHDYNYDPDSGSFGYQETLEWLLSDGTTEGTTATNIPLTHGGHMSTDLSIYHGAALINTSLDLIGNSTQNYTFNEFF